MAGPALAARWVLGPNGLAADRGRSLLLALSLACIACSIAPDKARPSIEPDKTQPASVAPDKARPTSIAPDKARPAYDRDLGGYPVETEARPDGHEQTGMISYYGGKFHGRKTASGARFDKHAMTAAHRTLPFGTRLRVTNLANGKSVVVTVNDRGPFAHGRILDLSEAAARKIGMLEKGTIKAKVTVL